MHLKTLATLLLAVASVSTAQAADGRYSLGVGATTLGYGVDANLRLSERFSATASWSTFSVDGDVDTDEVAYTGELSSDNASVALNWHPFAGSFHLSAGLVAGDLQAVVTGTPVAGSSYTFNGQTYTAAQVGQLRGEVVIKDNMAPYAGIGWRSQRKGLGAYAQIGVMAARTGVALSATGMLADPRLAADLEAERASLEQEVDLSLYPVIGAGLHWRF
ncbi:hypothetical protein ABB25_10775 [Stenotrophomonas koreensis]|uniref:Outer membrane protein beta-barrel domain-containing protein n=1 Tax=Stenotrophomonas koreensis TaxID=266128 RepID=A0A0R0BIC4_9GAMM|nr:hypothetical protein [Stenotrophomonas koreensis]KRG57116.1 hypothetical protein ABB25_10775 [Stenotrophomonas koreensis]